VIAYVIDDDLVCVTNVFYGGRDALYGVKREND
jgi:hypothetical protein